MDWHVRLLCQLSNWLSHTTQNSVLYVEYYMILNRWSAQSKYIKNATSFMELDMRVDTMLQYGTFTSQNLWINFSCTSSMYLLPLSNTCSTTMNKHNLLLPILNSHWMVVVLLHICHHPCTTLSSLYQYYYNLLCSVCSKHTVIL